MGEDGCEVLHGSEGYYVGAREIGAGEQGFGSVGDYIDVGQCKCAGYFAEESGFLVIRFDQREVDLWSPDFQGKCGESGAGTYVEDAGNAVVGGQWAVVSTSLRSPGRMMGRVGVLRLRRAIRVADGVAALRMTPVVGGLCDRRLLGGVGVRGQECPRYRVCGEEVACHKEGLAEVAGYYFFFFADGGQIDAGVPAK